MENTVSKKLYVGSLPYSVDDIQLEELAKPFGEIVSAKVIVDKFSGQSKGFGFVEFTNADDADKAVEGLNGKDVGGRALVVNEARPPTNRGGGGGGGGGRGDRGRRDSGSRW
jgi:RNA recognition motif-containing protein